MQNCKATMCVAAIVCIACGGGDNPTAPKEPTRDAPAVTFRLDQGVAAMQLVAPDSPSVRYTACGSVEASGGEAVAYTLELEPLGADGRTYVTVNNRVEGMIDANRGIAGCGWLGATDYSFAHPAAGAYRVRLRHHAASGRPSREHVTVLDAPVRSLINQLPSRLLIRGFRARGPNGIEDQFVELFNDSLTPARLTGGVISGGARSGANYFSFLPDAVVGPGCSFLLTAPHYSGTVRGDAAIPPFILDNGFIAVRVGNNPFNQFEVWDRVGMDDSSQYKEGQALAPFGNDNSDVSYSRIGPDTNNNARDFRMVSPSDPRSSLSCGSFLSPQHIRRFSNSS